MRKGIRELRQEKDQALGGICFPFLSSKRSSNPQEKI